MSAANRLCLCCHKCGDHCTCCDTCESKAFFYRPPSERCEVCAVPMMPVPRCDGCKWWERSFIGTAERLSAEQSRERLRHGECVLFRDPDLDVGHRVGQHPERPGDLLASVEGEGYEVDGAYFHTREDFGCVQHGAKP